MTNIIGSCAQSSAISIGAIIVVSMLLFGCAQTSPTPNEIFGAASPGGLEAQCTATSCKCNRKEPDDSVETCSNMFANCKAVGAEAIVCPLDSDVCSCEAPAPSQPEG